MKNKSVIIFAMGISLMMIIPLTDAKTFSTVKFNLDFQKSNFPGMTVSDYYTCLENNSFNYFTGWSFSGSMPIKTEIKSGGSVYESSISVGTETDMESESVFLTYSKGTCGNMDIRKELIENKDFLDRPFPSFSYRMPENYYINILLEYDNLNITNDERFSKGKHKVSINYLGETEGKVDMNIEV